MRLKSLLNADDRSILMGSTLQITPKSIYTIKARSISLFQFFHCSYCFSIRFCKFVRCQSLHIRETKRADQSDTLREVLSEPIAARTALAHIRLATIGNVEDENCHPFVGTDSSGRSWTLIHNGTVFEDDRLNSYVFLQKGETDSERILLYILDSINEASAKLGRALNAEERFHLLDGFISSSSAKNKMNLLIYDGEIMYAHTNFRDSLYLKKDGFGVIFSTRPLTESGWQPAPFMMLTGWREGELQFTGTRHHNEYFFNANSYKPIYLAYSGL